MCIRYKLVSLLYFVLLFFSSFSYSQQRLFVSKIKVEGNVSITNSQWNALNEELKIVIGNNIDSNEYILLSTESIVELLPPGSKLEDCIGKCIVEVGKKVQAHITVHGNLMQINNCFYLYLTATKTSNSVILKKTSIKFNFFKEAFSKISKIRLLGSTKKVKERIQVGFLKLIAFPPAEVFINGKSAGWTPLINHKLAEGRHQIKLRSLSGEEKTIIQAILANRINLRKVRLHELSAEKSRFKILSDIDRRRFSSRAFDRALSTRSSRLIKCIEDESQRSPIQKVFKVTMTVQRTGRFLNARLVNGSGPGIQCVFRAIQGLKMKPFSGDDKTITLPYRIK